MEAVIAIKKIHLIFDEWKYWNQPSYVTNQPDPDTGVRVVVLCTYNRMPSIYTSISILDSSESACDMQM